MNYNESFQCFDTLLVGNRRGIRSVKSWVLVCLWWHLTDSTKLRLYNSCILPIFLYGAETWAVTATAAKTFDALDQWCLRRIVNIHWTERITNNEVRSRTQQPLLSDAVRSRRLHFFGHICRADPNQDHSRALYAITTGLPKHWRRRPGRPR